MKRRTFVIGLATAGTAGLAGCSAPVGTKALRDPDRTEKDSETHLTYRDENGRIGTTTVQYGPVHSSGLLRLRISLWHRENTTVSDLTVTIRNRDPTAVQPSVYVGGFSGEFPAITHGIDSDTQGRRLEVGNLQTVGRGTVTLEVYVQSYGEWPLDLAIDVAYGLDDGLFRDYDVDGTIDLTVPGPGQSDA